MFVTFQLVISEPTRALSTGSMNSLL